MSSGFCWTKYIRGGLVNRCIGSGKVHKFYLTSNNKIKLNWLFPTGGELVV